MSGPNFYLPQVSSLGIGFLLIVNCVGANEKQSPWRPVPQFSSDAPMPLPSTNSPSHPFPVQVQASILDIEHIDGLRMEMHVQVHLLQYWASVESNWTNLSNSTIWVPDTIVSNQRIGGGERQRLWQGGRDFALKYNPGSEQLQKSEVVFAVVKCESMDFTRYPFDYQSCAVRFRSASDNQQIRYVWKRSNGADFSDIVKRYDLVFPFRVVQISMRQSKSNGVNSGASTEISLDIQIQRLWSAYVNRFYVPMTTFVSMSLLSLWLVHPKISFVENFVNILSMNIFLAIWDLHSEIPKLSYCTAMDVYSIICFVFIFLMLILNVYILFYIKSDDDDGSEDERHNESILSSQEQKYFLPKRDERSFQMRPHPFIRTIHSRCSANASTAGGGESGAHQQQVETDSPVEVVPRRRSKSTWASVRGTFLDKIRRSGHTIFLFTFIGVFLLYWVVLLSIYYTTAT